MKKIKLLFVITRATKCGPIQVIENILNYIDYKKFELYLISTEKEIAERTILESFKKRFNSYSYIPVSKTEAVLGRYNKLRKKIKEINPDVIHSNGIIPDLMISNICSEKQLMIAHANYSIDYCYLFGKTKGKILARLHIHLMKKARMCVACSESLSLIYKKQGLKIPYIRNGVNVESPQKYNKDNLREKMGLPKDKKIFIYAASFNPRKNQVFLAEFFSKRSSNNEVLLLLGDGPTYEDIRTKYASPKVIFAGRKSNVRPYLQASDFFISSSIQEGMPMAVLEGMAEGLPVILSDIDQHEELFRANADIGFLYKNNSTKSLYDALQKLRQSNYDLLKNNAYQTVLDYFNAEKMSLEYQKLYEKIADSHR